MKMNDDKKVWTKPTVFSVERLQTAASGSHNGLRKGPAALEYDYDGLGS